MNRIQRLETVQHLNRVLKLEESRRFHNGNSKKEKVAPLVMARQLVPINTQPSLETPSPMKKRLRVQFYVRVGYEMERACLKSGYGHGSGSAQLNVECDSGIVHWDE